MRAKRVLERRGGNPRACKPDRFWPPAAIKSNCQSINDQKWCHSWLNRSTRKRSLVASAPLGRHDSPSGEKALVPPVALSQQHVVLEISLGRTSGDLPGEMEGEIILC